MRVVVDTNVLVGALLGGRGPNRDFIRACLRREFEPQMGNALFAEYEDVVERDSIRDKCRLSPREAGQLVDAFMSVSRWVEVYYLWRPNLPDEADNHLVELAVASGAGAIVTHNTKDFRRTSLRFDHIQIVTPAQILEERTQ